MNNNYFLNVLKHGSRYLSGSLIVGVVALLMTKYYTTVFSPTQFGILSLYLVMFEYVMTFASLNLHSGSTRLYFDYRSLKRDEYLSTIFWLITFISAIVLIIGLSLMDPVSNWIQPNSQKIYFITLCAGIIGVYVSFLTRVLYNEEKSNSVLKHMIFQSFINHVSSVVLISVFHLGVFGRVSGQGLGYSLNVFTLMKETSKKNLFRLKLFFNKSMAKETLMLTLPSVISSIQVVVFIYLDRIFIKYYIGDSAVGIYSLGFLLGKGLSMVSNAVSQSILPEVYNSMNQNYEKSRDKLERFSYGYYIGLVIITFIISVFSPVIISTFANENFSQAASVMPYIMAGFMMGGFYKIPALVLGYHKRVWFHPFLALISFGTNALLNLWLIPIYGIVGAAFASFIGLFLYSINKHPKSLIDIFSKLLLSSIMFY